MVDFIMENITSVEQKLQTFYESKKIPHIIFHGPSGSGKRTIVENFLTKIYDNDKSKMLSNIMWVNCAHGNGRGIKFIREEVKFFAKSNIQLNRGVIFKTIVLLNANLLTNDAQSALRRCIEQFSLNTRFFIIVENKQKLLNPILSRFCEIYVPERMDKNGNIINLHHHTITNAYNMEKFNNHRRQILCNLMSVLNTQFNHTVLVALVTELYDLGYSCLDVIEWFKTDCNLKKKHISQVIMCFHKVKSEYRCEKLLMLYILDYTFFCKNTDLHDIGFI
jgi:GTPase SAR1 family protein